MGRHNPIRRMKRAKFEFKMSRKPLKNYTTISERLFKIIEQINNRTLKLKGK